MTPGSVTVDSMGEQEVSGEKVQELRVRTEDNEIDLFLDGPKLVRLVVAPPPTPKSSANNRSQQNKKTREKLPGPLQLNFPART